MVKCSKCGKTLSNPESIIRGMGPICYGKDYTYKRLRINNKEDRLLTSMDLDRKYGKEQIIEWANIEIEEYKKEHKKSKYPKNVKLRQRKIKYKEIDKFQLNLDEYIIIEETELDRLRAEFRTLIGTRINRHEDQDKALELIKQITELEKK